jgi:type IX secretion system PorP/SprF family membrane protein
MKKYFLLYLLLTVTGALQQALSQQHYNNPISQFFRNRYLINPAFAGNHTRPYVYGLVNRSWIGFEGAPTLVQFSGDTYMGKNTGAGIQLLSDKAGEMQRMLAKLSYSYKISLGGTDEFMRLGISLTSYKEQLSPEIIREGVSDELIKSFNSRGWRFDGDFGAVYQNKTFFFSAALVNLNRWYSDLLKQMPVDMETFSLTTAYTYVTDEKVTIQPLLSAKFYSRTPWLCKVGAELGYNNQFHASLLWQNNNSIQGGLGMQLKDFGEINFFYGSANAQGAAQQMEVGLGINL